MKFLRASRDSYGSYQRSEELPYLTPPGSPIIMKQTNSQSDIESIDNINKDLLDQFSGESLSISMPMMDLQMDVDFRQNILDNYPMMEIQTQIAQPYLSLEFVATMTLNILLGCNYFAFLLYQDARGLYQDPLSKNYDVINNYPWQQIINISSIGMVQYIFTNPDTFRSINLSMESFSVNSVVYQYNYSARIKYVTIHIISALCAGFLVVGVFYNALSKYNTNNILDAIFSKKLHLRFDVHSIAASVIVNIYLSFGLTILTNTTTTENARTKSIHKTVLMLMANLSLGLILGPIGYVLPSISLYFAVLVARNEFESTDAHLIVVYICLLIAIIVIYPLVVFQIKYTWRNKYRRYIEYGM